jgi:NADH:ubiquinone oxidoreductase subunit K
MIDPHAALALSAALFALGIFGALVRRSVISVLLSLEFMFAATVVALVSFDRTLPLTDLGSHGVEGQGFALLILTVATAQMMVGLGLLFAAQRSRGASGREEPGALRW